MWGSFHRLRTSVTFISRWKNFLKEVITATACPIFFQHLTSTIFMDMIRQEFPVVETGPQRQEAQALSYEEKNALRYAAGYVPRHLKKRLRTLLSMVWRYTIRATLYGLPPGRKSLRCGCRNGRSLGLKPQRGRFMHIIKSAQLK